MAVIVRVTQKEENIFMPTSCLNLKLIQDSGNGIPIFLVVLVCELVLVDFLNGDDSATVMSFSSATFTIS